MLNKLLLLLVVPAVTGFVAVPHEEITIPGIGGISGTSKPPINISVSGASSYQESISIFKPGSSEEEEPTPTTTGPIDYFLCPTYGPFHVGDRDFTATFQYRANIDNQEIIERLRLLDTNNNVLQASSKAAKMYSNNELIEVSFNVPIRDYLTESGIILKFEIIKKSNYSVLKTYSTTLYPLTSVSNNANYLKQNIISTNPIGFYGDGEGMKTISETFDFTKLGDYLDINYYYHLNIKKNQFYYTSDFPLSYTAINLRFEDHDFLFPYFSHDSSFNVNVPLRASVTNSKVTLSYKNYFYVNKRTLQVSQTAKTGFTLTPELYLPINGKNRFNNKLLYLDFVDFGQSKITVSFPIRYQVNKSLVGVSDDGINYVSGGVKND